MSKSRFAKAVEEIINIHTEQLQEEVKLREELNNALRDCIKLSDEVIRLRKELGYE